VPAGIGRGGGALTPSGNVGECFVYKQLQSNAEFFTVVWRVGVVDLVVLVFVVRVMRATAENSCQLFLRKKVHPRENTTYACECAHPWKKSCRRPCVSVCAL